MRDYCEQSACWFIVKRGKGEARRGVAAGDHPAEALNKQLQGLPTQAKLTRFITNQLTRQDYPLLLGAGRGGAGWGGCQGGYLHQGWSALTAAAGFLSAVAVAHQTQREAENFVSKQRNTK